MEGLIREYIAMSQKGTVPFYEETVFLNIAEHLREQDLLDKAFEALSHGIEYYPSSSDLHTAKAQLYAELLEETLSLKHIDKALIFSPFDTYILTVKVEILTQFERFEEAKAVIKILEEQTLPQESIDNIYLLKAKLYDIMEEVDLSFDVLADAVIANPRNNRALERMSLMADYSERYEESKAVHETVLNHDPYSSLAWFNLGQAQQALHEYADAAESFEFAFITNPQYQTAYLACAKTCIKSGWYHKALNCLQEANHRFGESCELLIQTGYCHELLSNYMIAESFYRKALRLSPNSASATFRMGQCLKKNLQTPAAIPFFKRSLELSPSNDEYAAALADAYYSVDDVAAANKYFALATEIAPEIQKYWVDYVSFLIVLGSFDCAHNIIEEAEINAYDTYVLYCRVACLYTEGTRKEALNVLVEALEEDGGTAHQILLDLAPDAVHDKDILNLLSAYKSDC
jgi:tetratricopeptide (TPR) repeat protein